MSHHNLICLYYTRALNYRPNLFFLYDYYPPPIDYICTNTQTPKYTKRLHYSLLNIVFNVSTIYC